MRTNAARKSNLGIIHPASTSRIERVATELDTLSEQIKALETTKVELNARLLLMVKREGNEDEKGKIRYETEQHKFVVVAGKNTHTSGDKVKQALVSLGVSPKIAVKAIAKGTTTKEYEYVHRGKAKAEGEPQG